MRSRLLDNLYTAFNRDPGEVVAFTLSHAGGVAWSVSDRELKVFTEAGVPLVTVPLATGLLSGVVAALTGAGVTVENINPSLQSLHSSVLIEGSGIESASNGNIIYAHNSVLWAILSSYAIEVNTAGDAVPAALDQVHMDRAQGDWLDFWGQYFAVERVAGQGDAAYLSTIILETLRPRSNKYAIQTAIADATGYDVTIDEPWEKMFMLDGSELSGDHRIKDGSVYMRNIIRPTAIGDVAWGDVLAVIEKVRAAGVIVIQPQTLVSRYSRIKYPSMSWRRAKWMHETWATINFVITSAHTTTTV